MDITKCFTSTSSSPLPFYLQKTNPSQYEVFYDLGCGAGKAVLAAALFFKLDQAYGIELLPAVYELANAQLEKARPLLSVQNVKFMHADFLEYDFSDGDIVFINATCLGALNWSKVVAKLLYLKPGSRVIVITKKIEHPQFRQVYNGKEAMSWGMASVNIYVKHA